MIKDTVLHLKEVDGRALDFADGLMRFADGSLTFAPGFLLGDDEPEKAKGELRRAPRRLLDQSFDNLLFAHGTPLIGGGMEALEAFFEYR